MTPSRSPRRRRSTLTTRGPPVLFGDDPPGMNRMTSLVPTLLVAQEVGAPATGREAITTIMPLGAEVECRLFRPYRGFFRLEAALTLAKKAPPFPTYVRWFCGACGEANSMKREHCNVCRSSQDDNRNVFQEGMHWNACNSPYCKGVRLRDSVLTRYAPTEPGSSSSAGQEGGAPPKSSAGAKAGPPSQGPKPAYKEPPDTSCQSRPTGGQPKPVYKVQGKGGAEKKTKPPPFGVKRPSGQCARSRRKFLNNTATPQPVSSHGRKLLRPRPTSHQGATARSLSPRPLG